MKHLICGFSGSGKSSLLRDVELNAPLNNNIRFIDLDEEICKKYAINTGSLGDFIRDKGWEYFRQVELESLIKILKNQAFICSLGGGALNKASLSEILKYTGVKICWLDESFERCYNNIVADSNRPLAGQSRQELEKIYLERIQYYCQAEHRLGYEDLKQFLLGELSSSTICHSDGA